jgi:hypothetical protein
MKYELLFTRETEIEVERTIAYLANRSPQGAAAWCEQWESVLTELKSNPLLHGLAPESADYGWRFVGYFSNSPRPQVSLFTIVGRGVYVIQLRGPSQNLVRRDQLRRKR